MLKNVSELSNNVRKEIEKRVNALQEGQMLLVELSPNGEIVNSVSSSKNKDLGKAVGFMQHSPNSGDYVKRDDLEKHLEKSQHIYVFDYSKASLRSNGQRIRKDSNVIINGAVAELVNIKKGGAYKQDDINEMIDSNAIIQDYKSRNEAIQNAILNDLSKLGELSKGFKELKEKADAEQARIEALLGQERPSKYTSEEIAELGKLFIEVLTIVNDNRSGNEKITHFEVTTILAQTKENQEKEEVVE